VNTEEHLADENFFDFKCPYCGGTVSFPVGDAGFVRDCPDCTQCIIVPTVGGESGLPLPFPLTTPRLVLRRLREGDADGLLEVLADDEMYRFVSGVPVGEEQIARLLENDAVVRLTTPGQMFCLGLELQEGGKLIGYVTLQLEDLIQGWLNVYVGRTHQKQGFASEAVAALLDFCFDGISVHRLGAFCDSRNAAARRVFEKVGMRREGEFLKSKFQNGEWTDVVYYGLLGEEYRASEDGSQKSDGK
jgi:RimJ/RimL family protein N-acetyltransferase